MSSKSEYLQRRGYRVLDRIAKGSFGKVFKALHVPSNSLRAVKIISNQTQTEEMKKCTQREIEALKRSTHENILRLYETFITPNYTFIITALHDTDLKEFVEKRGVLTELQAQLVVQQVAQGIEFLWQQQIIHRDLKPANLLLSLRDDDIAQVVIADFGFARELAAKSMASTLVGTPLYVAPELLQHQPYGPEADLWSVGCILYEMVTGTHPFSVVDGKQAINMPGLKSNIERYFRLHKAVTFPASISVSQWCTTLVQGLLQIHPHARRAFMQRFTETVKCWQNDTTGAGTAPASAAPAAPPSPPQALAAAPAAEQPSSVNPVPPPQPSTSVAAVPSPNVLPIPQPGMALSQSLSKLPDVPQPGMALSQSLSKLPDDQLSAAQLRKRVSKRAGSNGGESGGGDAGGSNGNGTPGGGRGAGQGGDKIVLHLRADGGAPILRVSKQYCAGHLPLKSVLDFLRKTLRLRPGSGGATKGKGGSDDSGDPLFVYCHLPYSGNAFAPGPEERILTLFEGFGNRESFGASGGGAGAKKAGRGNTQQPQRTLVLHYALHDFPAGWCSKCHWRECCCPREVPPRPSYPSYAAACKGACAGGSGGGSINDGQDADTCEAMDRMRRSRYAFDRTATATAGTGHCSSMDESYVVMQDAALVPVSLHHVSIREQQQRRYSPRLQAAYAHARSKLAGSGSGSSGSGGGSHSNSSRTAPSTIPISKVASAAGASTIPINVSSNNMNINNASSAGPSPYYNYKTSPHTPPLRPTAEQDQELDGFVLVDEDFEVATTDEDGGSGAASATQARALLARVFGF